MADQDVKQLLLQVDATVELLRKELGKGEQKISEFERFVAQKMRQSDQHFAGLGRGLSGVRKAVGQTQTSIIALGATLTTYMSGRQLVTLLDNFTRLQNSLKVAGLEGDQLKAVQDRLFESAQKNGVAINTLADLYGKAASAQKDLGATQSQLLTLTDLTAKSLLITGTSTEQASGAILGLGQALGNTKLQAEEFNQINEGGLRPLLQAAAAGERFGGSVSKLRQAVVDGKITNKEFFDLILKGAKDIEDKAAKATLTLAAGYNALTNALTVYFGEADKANGVSAALGEALGALAANLDTIVPAVTLLVTALGVRYVVAATAAVASTLATSNAMIALQARMIGAATTAEALNLALSGVGRANAITIGILAMGGALYYVVDQMTGAKEATGQFAKTLERSEKVAKDSADAIEKLATATGKARAAALEAARAQRQKAEDTLKAARADNIAAEAALQLARARAQERLSAAQQATPLLGDPRGFGLSQADTSSAVTQAEANVAASQKAITDQMREIARLNEAIDKPPSVPGASSPDKGKGKGGSGRSAGDITKQFNDELAGLLVQTNSAYSSIAKSADERAEYELRNVELARIRARDDIKSNSDYSAARKRQLTEQVEFLADAERARIEFDRKRQNEQDAAQIADEQNRVASEVLRQQYDLSDSNAERRRLAQELLALEIRHQRAVQEAIVASETATAAEKERARIVLGGLDRLEQGRKAGVDRDHESPGERYLRDLNKEAANLGDAYEDVAVRGLDRLNDSLSEAAKNALGLHGILGDIVGDLIEIAIRQQIIGPLAGALFGGGGGLLGGLFGGFRAGGGPVDAGKAYVVGEKRPELFVPSVPGKIIPSVGGAGGSSISMTINAPGATAETVAMIRREISNAAPLLVQAARGATIATLQRPRLS